LIAMVVFGFAVLANNALAVPPPPSQPLVVEFEGGSPLFNKTNFTPGDSITKWIKVTNTSGLTQRIAIEAINFAKPVLETDLSRTLMIVIKQGATEIYGGAGNEKTLYQFYQNGETYLSELTNDNLAQYDITISFPADRGDAWQEKTTGFDVVVGFEGTEGGLTPLSPGQGMASAGNGPPGGLPPGLTILNETTASTTEISVTIIWNTSYPATSQVIYALESESHTLNLNDNGGAPPKYGYFRTTPETDTFSKVLNHSVTIDGLTSGTKYYFRAVSHGSLAVSTEHSFTTLTPEEAIAQAGAGATQPLRTGEGVIQGTEEGTAAGFLLGTTTTTTKENPVSTSLSGGARNLAASILGLSGSWIFWIILFLIFLIILFLVNKKKKKNN